MTTTAAPAPLTALDRCDRCGAQAYIVITLPSGLVLTFCGHHGTAHAPKAVEAGATVRDETARLKADAPV